MSPTPTGSPRETWSSRAQLLIRPEHQPTLWWLLLLIFVAILLRWAWPWIRDQPSVELDRAVSRPVTFLIDINRAGWAEFANLPGIGEGIGREIVSCRESRGGFRSIDELETVPGIGPGRMNAIRPYLVYSGETFQFRDK